MKKILSIMMLLVLSAALYAQKEVTKFLGIPVDGTKAAMIQKLKAKGFTTSPYDRDILVGNFNGGKVNVHVVTNNGKVCRVMVWDAVKANEADIRIRFNHLCRQFSENKKYISVSSSDYLLPEGEDISYEISVNNKRYEAGYCQLPSGVDKTRVDDVIYSSFQKKYTEEQLASFTEEQIKKYIEETAIEEFEKWEKNSVWFRIGENYGKYFIIMFYDNKYNQANGEDL